jgi:hypothetical protein
MSGGTPATDLNDTCDSKWTNIFNFYYSQIIANQELN